MLICRQERTGGGTTPEKLTSIVSEYLTYIYIYIYICVCVCVCVYVCKDLLMFSSLSFLVCNVSKTFRD